MVGSSASRTEAPMCSKQVDFSVSHYAKETANDKSQDTMKNISTTRTEDRPIVTPRSTISMPSTMDPMSHKRTLETDEGGLIPDVTSLEVQDMDITTPD